MWVNLTVAQADCQTVKLNNSMPNFPATWYMYMSIFLMIRQVLLCILLCRKFASILFANVCVKIFRVTIFLFISNVHHIFAVYCNTSKKFSCKKFSLLCMNEKLLTTKILRITVYIPFPLLLQWSSPCTNSRPQRMCQHRGHWCWRRRVSWCPCSRTASVWVPLPWHRS